jgi:hypothetical protein
VDRLYKGLGGQTVQRVGWTDCTKAWVDRLYKGLGRQTVQRLGWTDCTKAWMDRLQKASSESQAYIK